MSPNVLDLLRVAKQHRGRVRGTCLASKDACLRGILNVYVCGAKYNEARTVKRKGPLKLIELKGNLIRG